MFDDSVRVGRELKSAIKAAGLSQTAVAKAFGVSQPWISRILNGQFGDRTELVIQMCDAYSVAPYAHSLGQEGGFDDVVAALGRIWDGTAAGAKRLQVLLAAVQAIHDRAT